MTAFWCVPVCKTCRESGECSRAGDFNTIGSSESIDARTRANPWGGDCLALPCGCFILPWGFIEYFGQNIISVSCDEHGEQKFTKAAFKRLKKQGEMILREYATRERKAEEIALFREGEIPF